MQSSLISKLINERNEKLSASILTRVLIESEYVSTASSTLCTQCKCMNCQFDTNQLRVEYIDIRYTLTSVE